MSITISIKETQFWKDLCIKAELITIGQYIGIAPTEALMSTKKDLMRRYTQLGLKPSACTNDKDLRTLQMKRGTTVQERKDLRDRLARGSNTVIRSTLGELYEVPLSE